MFRRFPQHPDRQAIHDEAHARPPLSIKRDWGEVWHWVLSNGVGEASWPSAIDPSQRHQLIKFDNGVVATIDNSRQAVCVPVGLVECSL